MKERITGKSLVSHFGAPPLEKIGAERKNKKETKGKYYYNTLSIHVKLRQGSARDGNKKERKKMEYKMSWKMKFVYLLDFTERFAELLRLNVFNFTVFLVSVSFFFVYLFCQYVHQHPS